MLPVAVSPLFYATSYAHDLKLRVALPNDAAVDLPLVADVTRGGLIIATATPLPANLAGPLKGTVQGEWGFDPFAGPQVTLAAAGDWRWQPKNNGNEDGSRVLLTGAPASCVTTSGSRAVPPAATRLSASVNSATFATRSLSR